VASAGSPAARWSVERSTGSAACWRTRRRPTNETAQRNTTLNVLGISGSLRQGSCNGMALRAAQKLAPAGMRITIADIRPIPLKRVG